MKYYSFLPSGEYSGSGDAKLSPLEKDVYLLPGRATFIEPPQASENEVAIWNGQSWEIKPDFRGETVYDTATGEPFAICDIGPLRGGTTSYPPPEYKCTWTGETWELNLALEKASRLEKFRAAPSAYIYSKYDSGEQLSMLKIKVTGNDAQKVLCDQVDAWINSVLYDYYARRAAIQSAKDIDELNAVSADFRNNDATKPAIELSTIINEV